MINLPSLSGCVTLTKFKMETVSSVVGSIKKGGLMFLINLEDTYFQIPIHLDSCPYLWIALEGKVYQYKALCLGLSASHEVLTRVFALVMEWAHRKWIRLHQFLDDWLVFLGSIPLLLRHCEQHLELCEELGIVISMEK